MVIFKTETSDIRSKNAAVIRLSNFTFKAAPECFLLRSGETHTNQNFRKIYSHCAKTAGRI